MSPLYSFTKASGDFVGEDVIVNDELQGGLYPGDEEAMTAAFQLARLAADGDDRGSVEPDPQGVRMMIDVWRQDTEDIDEAELQQQYLIGRVAGPGAPVGEAPRGTLDPRAEQV